jgi:hypothetical protein
VQLRLQWEVTQIRDDISAGIGATFSRTQYSNLKHYRLGGGDASKNLEQLLDLFVAVEGNRCIVIHDQDDMIIGIILQTAIQRELFKRYGDSLVLDWTHNTNNLGFYGEFHISRDRRVVYSHSLLFHRLGCPMATSVTGKGKLTGES